MSFIFKLSLYLCGIISTELKTEQIDMKYSLELLNLQENAALISLFGFLLVIGIVIYLIASSSHKEEQEAATEKVYKLRGRYLWGLSGVLLVLLIISMSSMPYHSPYRDADKTISVVGYQWLWKMAPGMYNGNLSAFDGKDSIALPADKLIKFEVTSNDVNHNFAIYNSKGYIVAETQAMPGYKNVLYYTFKEKGDYKVLCLEYCGLAHAFMEATIHIQ